MKRYHPYVYKKQAALKKKGIKASLEEIQANYELKKKPITPCYRSEFNPDCHIEVNGKRYKKKGT